MFVFVSSKSLHSSLTCQGKERCDGWSEEWQKRRWEVMCYTNTSWGKKQLTRGQKVEEGYSVYGGIAKLQMYFVNVQSVDRKIKPKTCYAKMQVIK